MDKNINMKSLNEIMSYYGTDKQRVDNDYVTYYEDILKNNREKKLKLLEIGVYRPTKPEQDRPLGFWDGDKYTGGRRLPAASLRSWHDYLPNSEIYGVDVDDFKDINYDRIKTIVANQSIRGEGGLKTVIDTFGSDFDVIIDDGGHTMEQQLVTLAYIFKYLKPGGTLIIEDLITSNPNYHPKAYNPTNTKTTVEVLKEYMQTKKIDSVFITKDESEYLENNVSSCEIKISKTIREGDISLCVITKK